MTLVADLVAYLEKLAPLELAESWDNVGLLVGDSQQPVNRIMTALTIVPENVDEAIANKADLIITHHPLPFQPLKKITHDTIPGMLLCRLMRAGIAVYSPHTAWDNTRGGINEQIANLLKLIDVRPLIPGRLPHLQAANLGSGRCGNLAEPIRLSQLVEQLRIPLQLDTISTTAAPDRLAQRIGIVCGSGGSLLSAVKTASCDTFLTGEATFHQCLEAQASGVSLILLSHFASEKFALRKLSTTLQTDFSDIQVWSSLTEKEPTQIL